MITTMATTEARRARRADRRIPRNGSRWAVAILGCAAALALGAGCGGDDGAATSEDVAAVETGVVELGTTQNVSCEELGSEEVGGVERVVFTCGFDEEAEQDGEMRAARRCFVLEEDRSVTDVTAELRDRGSCPVTPL
jgi:hypothetical protein